jgi:hypothetical protein
MKQGLAAPALGHDMVTGIFIFYSQGLGQGEAIDEMILLI